MFPIVMALAQIHKIGGGGLAVKLSFTIVFILHPIRESLADSVWFEFRRSVSIFLYHLSDKRLER